MVAIQSWVGRIIGVATLLEATRKNGRAAYRCRCTICGRDDWIVETPNIKHCKSCGCLRNKLIAVARTTHGLSHTPTYHSWINLRARCNNPNKEGYQYYGGRGITYDPRWGVFENFLEDMGERPVDCELDRIDTDGNYCKTNCRWVTHAVNVRNRRVHVPSSQ